MKVFLHDSGWTSLDELVFAPSVVRYSNELPVYGCYAGVISNAKSNGVKIMPGSIFKKSVMFMEIKPDLEKDVEKLFDSL